MALASMTGFARSDGHHGAVRWTWELRSVNGKGLDLRMRLANGFERLEPIVREKVRAAFARGSITANLTVTIYNYAMSPYENWQKMAWGASFLIIIAVLSLNIFARYVIGRGVKKT